MKRGANPVSKCLNALRKQMSKSNQVRSVNLYNTLGMSDKTIHKVVEGQEKNFQFYLTLFDLQTL